MRRVANHGVRVTIASIGTVWLIAGCSAGQVTQTSDQETAIAGLNVNHGDIAIRDALVASSPETVWKKGSRVPLSMVLVNEGVAPDKLVKVASPAANDIILVEGRLEETSSPSPKSTASPSASASPTDEAPAIELAPAQPISLLGNADDSRFIVLEETREEIKPADQVRVTLTFERAGSVTLRLPVGPPDKPRTRVSFSPETEPGREEH